MTTATAEYIWIDGTRTLRSKTKVPGFLSVG